MRDSDAALHALTARFFKGLGDPVRLSILELLEDGERSVGEIVEYLQMPRRRQPSPLTNRPRHR